MCICLWQSSFVLRWPFAVNRMLKSSYWWTFLFARSPPSHRRNSHRCHALMESSRPGRARCRMFRPPPESPTHPVEKHTSYGRPRLFGWNRHCFSSFVGQIKSILESVLNWASIGSENSKRKPRGHSFELHWEKKPSCLLCAKFQFMFACLSIFLGERSGHKPLVSRSVIKIKVQLIKKFTLLNKLPQNNRVINLFLPLVIGSKTVDGKNGMVFWGCGSFSLVSGFFFFFFFRGVV